MNKNYIPFLSFLSYTQRFVSGHYYTSHRMRFWRPGEISPRLLRVNNITNFNTGWDNTCKLPIVPCLQQMLEILRKNTEAEVHVTPGRVKACIYNSFDVSSSRGENFTPIKIGGVISLVVNTVRGLTTHRIEFNPGRNSLRGEILVVSSHRRSSIRKNRS